MLRRERYYLGKLSVRLSVRPSVRPYVTLRHRDHIGWNSGKIISRLISLTFPPVLRTSCLTPHSVVNRPTEYVSHSVFVFSTVRNKNKKDVLSQR